MGLAGMIHNMIRAIRTTKLKKNQKLAIEDFASGVLTLCGIGLSLIPTPTQ
jgi:hypothetical protein